MVLEFGTNDLTCFHGTSIIDILCISISLSIDTNKNSRRISLKIFLILQLTKKIALLLLSIKIITDDPLWFSFFCVLLGVVYAFVLYRREEKFKAVSKWLVRAMAFFRFVLIAILAFLLLSPFIKTLFNKVEKPVIIIAQDNTSSILLNKDSAYYKTDYLLQLQALKSKLAEDYEVKSYTFGENVTEGDAIDYSKKVTDISNVFDEINNKFYNRNVGALILASDGIFNQGANPVFSTEIEFPIYTIALGDTSIQRDVILKEVSHNKLTFLGNQFPIEIEAEANQCEDQTTRLTITHNGKELFNKQFNINATHFLINENVLFEAKEVGVQHYRVMLSKIDGEISNQNNVQDIYIEVLDGRQNILILSNAPHPDVKALKLSIESNENYKVTTELLSEFDGKIEPYSLAIIHQLPANITPEVSKLIEGKVSVMYILGTQTAVNKFNALNTGLFINNPKNKLDEMLPKMANNFPLFTLAESTVKSINEMPPLLGQFGSYQLKTNAYVLLNQKIGSVETDNPLMVFFQDNGKKTAIIAAEGIWKWRMQDFLKNKNHDSFDELINKTVQFLSVKEDKSRFRVLTKNIHNENEEIQLNAELYNESYELINEPEISISITEENGDKYNFVFNRTSSSYILNAGILPAGYYNYKAKVKVGDKEYFANGKFQIKQLLLEANNTVANHQLMQNIAQKFGGKLVDPKQMNDIAKSIKENSNIVSVIYEENDLKELISLKWIFFVLLSLLSMEWFFRKRNGAY